MAHRAWSKRRVLTTKMKNQIIFWRYSSPYHKQPHPILTQKGQKSFHKSQRRVDFPLVETINQKFVFSHILYTFLLHWSDMIFSVPNDGI